MANPKNYTKKKRLIQRCRCRRWNVFAKNRPFFLVDGNFPSVISLAKLAPAEFQFYKALVIAPGAKFPLKVGHNEFCQRGRK